MMRRRMAMWAPVAIVGFALFLGAGGAMVQALWNWLVPSLFDARPVTFWQALGLLALCRILFGGFGHGRRFGGPRWRHRRHGGWGRMTSEERERFRAAVRARWGRGTSEREG